MATNAFGFVLAPADLDSHNVKSLTTPELEKCFQDHGNFGVGSNWTDLASSIAAVKYKRLDKQQCYDLTREINSSGVKLLVGLDETLSLDDGGNEAILVTTLVGGYPETTPSIENSFGGLWEAHVESLTWEIYGDVFSKELFTFDTPGKNGTVHVNQLNYDTDENNLLDCMNRSDDEEACRAVYETLSDVSNSSSLFPTFQELESRYLNVTHGANHSVSIQKSIRCVPEFIDGDKLYTYSPTSHSVNGCLAVEGEESCQLLYSPPICIAMTCAMIIKLGVMLLTLRAGRSQLPPLLTIGDAIVSFMRFPDTTTEGLCWMSESDVRRGKWKQLTPPGMEEQTLSWYSSVREPRHRIVTYRRFQKRKLWIQVPRIMQWVMTLGL